MRIGIDCRTISATPTGIGQYTTELVRQLARLTTDDVFVLFVDHSARAQVKQLTIGAAVDVRLLAAPERSRLGWLWQQWQWRRVIQVASIDVFHGPANVVPLFMPCPYVVTIHDLAIYDHPEWFPNGQWLATRLLVPRSIRRSARCIAVSQSTAHDLRRLFAQSTNHTTVIHEGGPTDQPDIPPPSDSSVPGVRPPYILTLSTREPRKNLPRLIAAFDQLLQQRTDLQQYQLVIAGSDGWNTEAIDTALANGIHRSQIVLTGYVTAAQKQNLLAQATFLAYPSLAEGFGLPILEAQAAGIPVLTSDCSSLPEVAGTAASYCDPTNTASIRSAITQLLDQPELRDRLIAAGTQNCSRFSWKRMAQQTVRVYQQSASVGKR